MVMKQNFSVMSKKRLTMNRVSEPFKTWGHIHTSRTVGL